MVECVCLPSRKICIETAEISIVIRMKGKEIISLSCSQNVRRKKKVPLDLIVSFLTLIRGFVYIQFHRIKRLLDKTIHDYTRIYRVVCA